MEKAIAAPSLKQDQIEALQAILPPSAEVASMLKAWRGADARYWKGSLTPCWLTVGIEPYGHCLGHWAPHSRTINLVPQLWRSPDGVDGVPSWVTSVLVHEACHQAQSQLYQDLDGANGPRGKWFDRSHRCPSWSRAVEDVIQGENLDVFCPVWHRSSGNIWHPWVPASEDWMTWERADPEARFDGRKLLSFGHAKCFMPEVTMADLIGCIGFPEKTPKGKPIDWEI